MLENVKEHLSALVHVYQNLSLHTWFRFMRTQPLFLLMWAYVHVLNVCICKLRLTYVHC